MKRKAISDMEELTNKARKLIIT